MPQYVELSHGPLYWKGYGGSGPTYVMVHGLGGSLANWDAIGPRLAMRARVIAMDLPGFGLSPPASDWSLGSHARAITEFVESVASRPVVLIGNSMGGLLAEMVAAEQPALVDGLVLISPATPPKFPDPRINWSMARRLVLSAAPVVGPAIAHHMMKAMTPRELVNESLRRITQKPGRVPMDMVESFVEVARARAHLPWAADAVPKTGQSIRDYLLKRSKFVAMIRDVRSPTLVVQGIDDPLVSPTSVEWLCSLRPDWELVQMDDTGHTPQIDAPVRLLSVIETWLNAHEGLELTA